MSGPVGPDLVAHRVALHLPSQLRHRPVERGREQQHLAVAMGLGEDPAHHRQESHVGHPIGFVDDDLADVARA